MWRAAQWPALLAFATSGHICLIGLSVNRYVWILVQIKQEMSGEAIQNLFSTLIIVFVRIGNGSKYNGQAARVGANPSRVHYCN